LAESILTSDELSQIEKLSPMFLESEDNRIEAQKLAASLAPMRPKRPLYYATTSLMRLPDEARDSMRYFGDYIDMLVKSWTTLAIGNNRSNHRSLGTNLGAIPRNIDPKPDFLKILESYNSSIYVPAKHDFKLPKGRTVHRFTTREALLTALISMRLAEKISIHHAALLSKQIVDSQVSVSLIIVDPMFKVLLTRVHLGDKPAFEVPFRTCSAASSLPDFASKLCQELTSSSGRIVRCLGIYKRPSGSGDMKELAFVIFSPFAKEAKESDMAWTSSNDLWGSLVANPAKEELDAFL
jgi:hypothetical protein